MKTKKCHSCGEEVSYTVGNCPHCGKSVPGGSFWGFIKFIVIFHLVAFSIGAILSTIFN